MFSSLWNAGAGLPPDGVVSVRVTAGLGIVFVPVLVSVIPSTVCWERRWLVIQWAVAETWKLPVGWVASCWPPDPHALMAIPAARAAIIPQLLSLHPLTASSTYHARSRLMPVRLPAWYVLCVLRPAR